MKLLMSPDILRNTSQKKENNFTNSSLSRMHIYSIFRPNAAQMPQSFMMMLCVCVKNTTLSCFKKVINNIAQIHKNARGTRWGVRIH
jgi:hypothetical protein